MCLMPASNPPTTPLPRLLLLAALALAGGCAIPQMQAPAPAAVPPSWSAATDQDAPPADLRGWWKAWGDPVLDGLVDRALAANPDLLVAASRVRQARLLAEAEPARFRPAITAGVHPMHDARATDSFLHASVDVAWEPGFFGQADGSRQAAGAQRAKAAWAGQGVRVMVVAETVRHYLEMRAAQQQAQLGARLADLEQRAAAKAEARLQARLAGPLDVAQARQRQAQAQAAAAAQRAQALEFAQGLALLLGQSRPDAAWLQPGSLPAVAPRSLQELPAAVLRNRPDVREAEASVWLAAGEAGVSRSELYPRILLGAGVLKSWNLTQHGSFPTHAVFSLAPSIDVPLFDWDRRRARADAAQEHTVEALLAHRKVVLQAVGEVEAALESLQARRQRRALLARAAEAQAAQATHQAARQAAGLSGDAEQLELQRLRLQAEGELSTADAGIALAVVQLYRAVGGAPLPAGIEADAKAGSPAEAAP